MNGVLKSAFVILTASAAGMFWAFSYRGNHPVAAIGAFFGQSDPTFTLAGWIAGVGVLAFLVGIGLLIAGLVAGPDPEIDRPLPTSNVVHPIGPAGFDRSRWNALLQYDQEIAEAAKQVAPLGQKWVSELASSFMALSDKSYLPGIVETIVSRATAEQTENERLRAIEKERQRAYELEQQRMVLARRERFGHWRDWLWAKKAWLVAASGGVVAIAVIIALWPKPPLISNDEKLSYGPWTSGCIQSQAGSCYVQRDVTASGQLFARIFMAQNHNVSERLSVVMGDRFRGVKLGTLTLDNSDSDGLGQPDSCSECDPGRECTKMCSWMTPTRVIEKISKAKIITVKAASSDGRSGEFIFPLDGYNDARSNWDAQAKFPSFPKSTNYRDARKALMASGWQPIKLPDAGKCEIGDTRCTNLPEMYFCAGVGVAACRFTWTRNGSVIDVIGVGEGVQTIDSVECRSGCASVPVQNADENSPKIVIKNIPPKPAVPGFDAVLKNLTKANPGANQGPPPGSLTTQELETLRQQILTCMSDALGQQKTAIDLEIAVTRDRTISSIRVIPPPDSTNTATDRQMELAAEQELRSPGCATLSLPPEKYDAWRTMTLHIEPAQPIYNQRQNDAMQRLIDGTQSKK